MDDFLVWVIAVDFDDIPEDDVVGFEHNGHNYAVYRLGDEVFATDGNCTHEAALLAEGFVIDGVIECPRHQGRFDVRSGRVLGGPVCVDLKTYPARKEDGKVLVGLPRKEAGSE